MRQLVQISYESIGSCLSPLAVEKRRADGREGAINGWTWTGLTPADAVIWVLAEVQIGTAAYVPGRYGGQARPTGRVDADS